jgi:7-carboxy-7-deazaguanine synthase
MSNPDGVLKYHEVFASINGESTDAGRPCTFVRLYGCDVGCSYCDQPQRKEDRKKTSTQCLINKVVALGVPYVCITGGEPLMQSESLYPFIYELLYKDFEVAIETSGCYLIEDTPYKRSFKYIMDIKLPSSGVAHKNKFENMFRLRCNDEIKFVVKNREDYEYALKVLKSYQIVSKVLFSPMFDDNLKPLIGEELVNWLLEDKLYQSRLAIQLHKVVGVR